MQRRGSEHDHGGYTTVDAGVASTTNSTRRDRVRPRSTRPSRRQSVTKRPYLARMVGKPTLEREEERLMEEGALPGFAWWYCGVAKT